MLGHQLRQNLVLGLDLLLQVGDPLLVGGVVRSRPLLEGGRAVLEELLLPAVEDRGLQAEFIAQLRDRFLLQQMPPKDGDFLFRRVVLPLLLHAFSPLPYWENASSIASQTSAVPERVDMNATLFPSGENCGRASIFVDARKVVAGFNAC